MQINKLKNYNGYEIIRIRKDGYYSYLSRDPTGRQITAMSLKEIKRRIYDNGRNQISNP